MKSGMGSLLGIVALTVGMLVGTILMGNSPKLGLDLEGGVEVVLRPAEDADNMALASVEENLVRAAEIIRRRVDAIGVAEPEVTVQDTDIVVQLPGVEDQQRAVALVGQTAELRFRPVLYPPINLSQLPEAAALYQSIHGTLKGEMADIVDNAFSSGEVTATTDGVTVTGTPADDVVGDDTSDTGDGEDESGFGVLTPGGESAAAFQAEDADTGVSPFQAETEPAPRSVTLERVPGVNGGPGTDDLFSALFSDTAEKDVEDASVVLTDGNQVYLLGPTIFTGAALEGAEAQLDQGWSISVTFKDGAQGTDLLNVAADMCYYQRSTCPTGSMATVLDRNVDSAVGFQSPVFDTNTIRISRGNIGFPKAEAEDTALVLDFGALPVEFQDPTEAGLVRTVSSTLGEGSLRAGMIAGVIGLMLVALYMIFYYRVLGLAAMLSLLISATLLYCIVSFLSETRGLALTLAGIVGLIVSIGVSLDSNVVYFENLKEEIASGRTLRSATDRAFPIAFKTVFWANMATLIGAVILFVITVGSVKGFALMLGIASVLDLVATYFFMRPLVHWLANRDSVEDKPGQFGIGLARKAVDA